MKTVSGKVKCIKVAALMTAMGSTAFTQSANAAVGNAANELDVSVAGNSVSVTVAAGTLNDSSEIYLVWDSTDRGSNFLAWPEANRLKYNGSVSSAAAIYVLDKSTVPDGYVMRVIVPSDIRLIDSWVRLSLNQYVDTGVMDTEVFGVELKAKPVLSTSNYSDLFGGKREDFGIFLNNDKANLKKFSFCYRKGSKTHFSFTDETNPHEISVREGTFIADGNVVKDGISSSALGVSGLTMLFGSAWSAATAGEPNGYCQSQWYYFRLFGSDGSTLANIVPALSGDAENPTPLFYDSVSGQIIAHSTKNGITVEALTYDTTATVTGIVAKAVSPQLATSTIAHWTGNGDLTNVNDPANWAITNVHGAVIENGCPDSDMRVVVHGRTNFNIPEGQTLSFKVLSFEDVELAQTCNWQGLGAAPSIDGVVDLAGNKLYLAGMSGTGTVTDTIGGGELHIVVGSGKISQNDMLSLAGLLKLVKEGEGTLVANKYQQTYTGGTLVAKGMLMSGQSNDDHAILGPEGAVVTVDKDAVYDINGYNNSCNQVFVLNGGTMKCSRIDHYEANTQLKTIRLTADSTLYAERSFGFEGSRSFPDTLFDLQGNKATVNIAAEKHFICRKATITAGTIDMIASGNGSFWFGTSVSAQRGYYTVATNVRMRINAALHIYEPADIGDYEALYSLDNNNGTQPLRVHGTFKPSAHNYFYGVTIMDGSAIDLSSRTNALPSVSSFSNGDNALKFASEARTVIVTLGGGNLPGGKLLTWTAETKPANVDNVTFVLGDTDGRYRLTVKDDGLYAVNGLMLIIR